MFVYVCMCMYVYVYVYVCVCMRMYVCMRGTLVNPCEGSAPLNTTDGNAKSGKHFAK